MQAATEANQSIATHREHHQTEFAAIAAEQRSVATEIERPFEAFKAFEDGDLDAKQCRTRVDALRERQGDLERRHRQLSELLEASEVDLPTTKELADRAREITDALQHGSPALIKRLLKQMVAEVRVDHRGAVQPSFWAHPRM